MLEDGGKRSLSNVIPLVDIRANQIGLLKQIISCDHSLNSLTLSKPKNSGSKHNGRETESFFLKTSICLTVKLSKTCLNPTWFALKQLRNNRNDSLWGFYQKCHFEASGFSFRTNWNFKCLLLLEF